MTEETLKRLDRYVTKNMKKIGVPVRRHLFIIGEESEDDPPDVDTFYIAARPLFHVLTAEHPQEDLGEMMALMAHILHENYATYEIDWEPDENGTYFLSDSAWRFVDELKTLWEAGIPALISYDEDYIYRKVKPEETVMIQCRCGKLIQQPRSTKGETWIVPCPICSLPWEYCDGIAKHPYMDAYPEMIDYKPFYDIPK